jgi:hypothetical protein
MPEAVALGAVQAGSMPQIPRAGEQIEAVRDEAERDDIEQ